MKLHIALLLLIASSTSVASGWGDPYGHNPYDHDPYAHENTQFRRSFQMTPDGLPILRREYLRQDSQGNYRSRTFTYTPFGMGSEQESSSFPPWGW